LVNYNEAFKRPFTDIKSLIIVFLLIILVLLTGCGSDITEEVSAVIIEEIVEGVDMSNYLTYESENYNIRFKYPPQFSICGDSLLGISFEIPDYGCFFPTDNIVFEIQNVSDDHYDYGKTYSDFTDAEMLEIFKERKIDSYEMFGKYSVKYETNAEKVLFGDYEGYLIYYHFEKEVYEDILYEYITVQDGIEYRFKLATYDNEFKDEYLKHFVAIASSFEIIDIPIKHYV